MLFRDFNMIAAISYTAQVAAEDRDTLQWGELEESAQSVYMQSALAVARGEPTAMGLVFEATAKAIFDYNAGQGLLALEELMNLGSTVMSLGLLNEEDVADTNIRESIVGLLQELQERRQGGARLTVSEDDIWSNPRYRALYLANNLDGSIETAAIFAPFLTGADDKVNETSLQVLAIAVDAAKLQFKTATGSKLAKHAVAIAETYALFIQPPGSVLEAEEQRELETVQ